MVVDADGRAKERVRHEVEQHVPPHLRRITRYIVFNHCLEEWLCEGMHVEWRGRHPIRALNEHLRRKKGIDYEKYLLPSFVEELDLSSLVQNNEEFASFLKALRHEELASH